MKSKSEMKRIAHQEASKVDKPREFKAVIKIIYDVSVDGSNSSWSLKEGFDPKIYGKHLVEHSALAKTQEALEIAREALTDNCKCVDGNGEPYWSCGSDCPLCEALTEMDKVMK